MTIAQYKLSAFKNWRSAFPAMPASWALGKAKANQWESPKPDERDARPIIYNPMLIANFGAGRWIENASHGLRLVGKSQELAGLCHNGWYLDQEFEDETVSGVVYQLPARNGKPRFLYGIDDPHNDDSALLSMEIVEGERFKSGYGESARDYEECRQAANWADDMAREYAENESAYQAAFRAGREFDDNRIETRALSAEFKSIKKALKNDPGIPSVLLGAANTRLLIITNRMAEISEQQPALEENYSDNPGWKDGVDNG